MRERLGGSTGLHLQGQSLVQGLLEHVGQLGADSHGVGGVAALDTSDIKRAAHHANLQVLHLGAHGHQTFVKLFRIQLVIEVQIKLLKGRDFVAFLRVATRQRERIVGGKRRGLVVLTQERPFGALDAFLYHHGVARAGRQGLFGSIVENPVVQCVVEPALDAFLHLLGFGHGQALQGDFLTALP